MAGRSCGGARAAGCLAAPSPWPLTRPRAHTRQPQFKTLFAVGLLASGLVSTIALTYAGQLIMAGLLRLEVRGWTRMVATRCVALVPALTGEAGPGTCCCCLGDAARLARPHATSASPRPAAVPALQAASPTLVLPPTASPARSGAGVTGKQ